MKKLNKSFAFFLLSAIILVGCGTSQLQTRAKLTRTVILDKSTHVNKNIYVQVSNTSGSGGEKLKLYDNLKSKLEAKGYNLVKSSKDASYGLFVNVLFANNLKEANAIKSGLSSGLLAGGSTAIGGGSGRNSLIVGAIAALGGGIIGSAMEDDIFRAVIDVEIRDYKSKEINTSRNTLDTGANIGNSERAGDMNSLAGNIGNNDGATEMSSGISESTTEYDKVNYNKYLTRLFVEAVRMNLKLKEALPILSSKASNQIVNLF